MTIYLSTGTNEYWTRSSRITREETATERAYTLTFMITDICHWTGKPKPPNPRQQIDVHTQPNPTFTIPIWMNPPWSKQIRFLVLGLRKRHHIKINQATSSTETTFPPNLRRMLTCATHPETLVSKTDKRKRIRKGCIGGVSNEGRDKKEGSRQDMSGPGWPLEDIINWAEDEEGNKNSWSTSRTAIKVHATQIWVFVAWCTIDIWKYKHKNNLKSVVK